MEWYERSFGSDYLMVYKHRDMQGAYQEVKTMIEWLHLPQGAEVLDLCCGMGRHSLALADFGYRVTGVDLSEALLEEARRRDQDHRVEWIRGDMREVPITRTFEAVVNLFTSFGYFLEDAENAKVFREIYRLLKPEGQFIVDFLNPDAVIRSLVPYSTRTDGPMIIEEARRIEDGFVRKRITIREEGKPERTYDEQVKLYREEELKAMAAEAGLTVKQVFGGYDGQPLDAGSSPRIILVGQKEGDR
jgi:ubiquinone/menaquinone biosynthesis C-methylase UbiE